MNAVSTHWARFLNSKCTFAARAPPQTPPRELTVFPRVSWLHLRVGVLRVREGMGGRRRRGKEKGRITPHPKGRVVYKFLVV